MINGSPRKSDTGHASYVYDQESGLYYCSARYYDPASRQWTTADSAKADGEQSAYQYCGGDPVEMVDPTGTSWYNPWDWVKRAAWWPSHCVHSHWNYFVQGPRDEMDHGNEWGNWREYGGGHGAEGIRGDQGGGEYNHFGNHGD